ncbi:helix-turn-helix domain-containing protein [bacterium]|nr:helix-turn-helix domain-containing protein [bacterium]
MNEKFEMGDWARGHYERVKDKPGFIAASLSIDITEQLYVRMKELGLSQRELARRIGRSQPYVCKLLNDGSNMTLLTLVKLVQALEMKVEMPVLKPVGKSTATTKSKRPKAAKTAVVKP